MVENARKTPKPILIGMQVAHLGAISFRLQILLTMVLYFSLLGLFASLFYIVFLIIISTVTLGLIYLAVPGFADMWNKFDNINRITEFCLQSWVVLVPIILVLSVTSIVCLSFDKQQKHTAKIFFSVLTMVASLAFALIMLLGVNG